jgi:hypothetical protein
MMQLTIPEPDDAVGRRFDWLVGSIVIATVLEIGWMRYLLGCEIITNPQEDSQRCQLYAVVGTEGSTMRDDGSNC